MRLLVLGGTVFLGRHLVAQALDRGHDVTLFTRGRHNPALFPEATHLRGDRGGDLGALGTGTWDVVVDTSGFVPADVLASSRLLARRAEHLVFVSSASAYRDWPAAPVDEASPTHECAADATDGDYGVLKAGAERAAIEAFGEDRVLLARAGLLVGPHDNIWRLPWWLDRVARGGPFAAPAPADRPLQLVDARDAATWLLDAAEARRAGPANLTGPAGATTFGGLLDAAGETTGSGAEPVWIGEDALAAAEISPWDELPLWAPQADAPGLWAVAVERAHEWGLRTRPVAETVADTWRWMREQAAAADGGLAYRRELRPAGLSEEREAALLSGRSASSAP